MESKDFLPQGLRPWTCFLTWLLLIHVLDFCLPMPWYQLISWPFIFSWFPWVTHCLLPVESTWHWVPVLLVCCVYTGHYHRLHSWLDAGTCCFLHSLVQPRTTSPFWEYLVLIFYYVLSSFVYWIDTHILSPLRIYVKAHRTVVPQFIY